VQRKNFANFSVLNSVLCITIPKNKFIGISLEREKWFLLSQFPAYNESGICEAVLVMLAMSLWLYSFYRFYLVWHNTLNFSESSIQGPQGWDILMNWIMERIRKDGSTNKSTVLGFIPSIYNLDLLSMMA
jgi:hypothetical protein